ncbi:MAG: ABC transporter permease [Candidatus Thorarchaeota archaeon]
MSFVSFLIRRMLLVIPVLFAVSFMVFLMIRMIPGDPALLLVPEDAPPEQVDYLRERWGLNKPIHEQYIVFLSNLLRGDFGTSIRTGRPVIEEIIPRFSNTIFLASSACLIAIIVGGLAGVISSAKPYSKTDNIAMIGAMIGVSAPSFWLGLMLMWIIAVELKILPAVGTGDYGHLFSLIPGLFFPPGSTLSEFLDELSNSIRHLTMPAITLSAFLMAVLARQTRSSMLEVLTSDYIRTARAKGASESRVIFYHSLKNALIPVLTVAGVAFGTMLGGSIVVETVFEYNGLGQYMIDSIHTRDYPVIQAVILWYALIFTVVNLFVDIIYGWLDPRIVYD